MIKNIIINLVALTLLFMLVMYGCPFYKIFGIICPACGTTRAWLSFFSGNITKAFRYNLFFPIMPIFVLLYIVPKKPKYLKLFLMLFAIVLFLYNALRHLGMFAIPI